MLDRCQPQSLPLSARLELCSAELDALEAQVPRTLQQVTARVVA